MPDLINPPAGMNIYLKSSSLMALLKNRVVSIMALLDDCEATLYGSFKKTCC